MRLVKKIIALSALALVAALMLTRTPSPEAGPASPLPKTAFAPARADLAETVFAMVLENARERGLSLSQPVTLCEACVAAHVGLPEERMRDRCDKACGLR